MRNIFIRSRKAENRKTIGKEGNKQTNKQNQAKGSKRKQAKEKKTSRKAGTLH